jgi:hypothetical protein
MQKKIQIMRRSSSRQFCFDVYTGLNLCLSCLHMTVTAVNDFYCTGRYNTLAVLDVNLKN